MKNENELRALFEIGQHPLRFVSRRSAQHADYQMEILGFETGAGEPVRGILTRPLEQTGPAPAILYIHAHGGAYALGASELIEGRNQIKGPLQGALAGAFAQRGYVALCIDLPMFGTRVGENEGAQAKARQWYGKSVAGQMLGELSSALDYLCTREEVDASRIGSFGISMGAVLGFWLASVDNRISCIAHHCCFADFATMIELNAHDGHGHYLTIPGLLNVTANGDIAGMIAPRPQLITVGGRDALTPPEAVEKAWEQTRAAYEAAKAIDNLTLYREPEGEHGESTAMREKMLAFFENAL